MLLLKNHSSCYNFFGRVGNGLLPFFSLSCCCIWLYSCGPAYCMETPILAKMFSGCHLRRAAPGAVSVGLGRLSATRLAQSTPKASPKPVIIYIKKN